MAFKAAGAPCSVFREHMLLNPSSFSSSQNDSDFFPETARIDGIPSRLGHTHDSTAYGTVPTEDSWQVRMSGSGSPANTNGTSRGGQLTQMGGGNRNYLHLTATASGVLSPNPASIMGAVMVGTAGTGTGGVLTIYDDLSAVAAHAIAVINTNNANFGGYEFNTVMSRGIFYVWTAGGSTPGDVTLTYT